jgi:hypothetical protein
MFLKKALQKRGSSTAKGKKMEQHSKMENGIVE